MKILLYGLIVFGLFAFNINVEAKTVSTSNCISLSYDMRLTSTDAQTAGQVSMLQSFLQEKGYLMKTVPKGYFGTVTQESVTYYQLKTGITPASGYVGSVTRGKIKSDSCGNEEIVKKGPKPTIKKVSSSLPKGSEVYVGGEVQITGKDLAGSSLSTTFVYLGDKKVEVRQASSELIWFVVPEIPLGTYKLYVSNENGKSKTFKLKVINSQAVISNEIPILTSVKPSKASGEVDITIKGKNLISGSTVTLSRDGQSVYTYTNTKASKNGKSLTFNLNLDLPQNIASKDYKLRVANIMGQSNELDFTISEDTSINIVSPNGGSFSAGSNMSVTWNKTGNDPKDSYYFVYLKDKSDQILGGKESGGTHFPLIFRESSLGYPSFNITLPTDIDNVVGGSPITPGRYYLEIDVANSSGVPIASATSKAFNITSSSKSSVTLLSPNGGEKYVVGGDYEIRWDRDISIANTPVYLQLEDTSKIGDTPEHYAPIPDYQSWVSNTGVYSWKIPQTLGNGVMKLGAGNVYKILISTYDGKISDWSDKTFSISQQNEYPPTAKIDFPVTADQVFTTSVNSSVTIVGQFGRGESENGDAVSTTFFFGDGNSQITNQPSNASTGGVASYHTYTEPGRYTVTLVFKTTNKSVTSEPIYIQVN